MSKSATILAGAMRAIVISDRLIRISEQEMTMQVKSETGSARRRKRLKLQLSALKKKNEPPAPSRLSASVSAYSDIDAPVLISTTMPVAKSDRNEMSIGINGEPFALARSRASVPKNTIITAAMYRAKLSGINTRYPTAAPTAE